MILSQVSLYALLTTAPIGHASMARTRNEAIIAASAQQTLWGWQSIRIEVTRVGPRELSVEFVDEKRRTSKVAVDVVTGTILGLTERAGIPSELPQVLRAAILEENLSDRLVVWPYERGYIVDCMPDFLSWKPGVDVRRTPTGFKAVQ